MPSNRPPISKHKAAFVLAMMTCALGAVMLIGAANGGADQKELGELVGVFGLAVAAAAAITFLMKRKSNARR